MVDIKLKEGQTGYDAVDEYIYKYWKHHGHGDVIIYLGISYNGNVYDYSKEVASPYNPIGVEYLNDWWEGQKFIKIFGIKSVDKLDISGGIYEE